MLLPARRCWHCGRVTELIWDEYLKRVSCPYCDYTQPPRGFGVTSRLKVAWTKLALVYKEREGVTIEQQRGPDGTV